MPRSIDPPAPFHPDSDSREKSQWFADEVQPHVAPLGAWLRVRFPWLRDCDDITQEASLRVWRKGNSGGAIKSPKAVLFAIARNLAFDLGRRRGLAVFDPIARIETLSVPDERADTAETVATRQELEMLALALDALPARCRQVLTLRKMYGYSQQEVAAQLGISEHTVHALVAKGMRRCVEYMRRRGFLDQPHE